MTARRHIPRSIEWAAALVIGIAAFITVVAIARFSLTEIWPLCAGLWAVAGVVAGVVAFGILRGQGWVRWLFMAGVALQVIALAIPTPMMRRAPVELWMDRGLTVTFFAVVGLCFLPPSGRYFAAPQAGGK